MAVSTSVLGMNARNYLYIRKYNPRKKRYLADNKLATKELLVQNHIATPQLLTTFRTRDDVRAFNFSSLPDDFVVKPANGYGGDGILVFDQWEKDWGSTIFDDMYDVSTLSSHLLDILEGAYSLHHFPDVAFIEKRVITSKLLRKYIPAGTPDIRIILFHLVPIMAMLRLPTKESGGKANLHQGAVGLGIDLASGITTHGVKHGKTIQRIPDTSYKTRGIKLPFWEDILLLAGRTQQISGLGFIGVDIVLDEKEGAMVLELNFRPGLSIQTANLDSLRTRLERIEGLHIDNPKRGVEVAKSLFAAPFAEKILTPTVLHVFEDIEIETPTGMTIVHKAKLDTGAWRTSIDAQLAVHLGLEGTEQRVKIRAASGREERQTVSLTFTVGGKKVKTVASLADRTHMKYPILIGRRDLKGFYINPVKLANEPTDLENQP